MRGPISRGTPGELGEPRAPHLRQLHMTGGGEAVVMLGFDPIMTDHL